MSVCAYHESGGGRQASSSRAAPTTREKPCHAEARKSGAAPDEIPVRCAAESTAAGQPGKKRERERDRDRDRDRETERDRERQRQRENSKTLFYKECRLGSVKNLSNN